MGADRVLIMLTPWLQELREILAITSYDGRREAMGHWERRWLVTLQHRQMLMADTDRQNSRELLTRTDEYVRRSLGQKLGELMVQVSHRDAGDPWRQWEPMIEVRGMVVAIRREPKVDD